MAYITKRRDKWFAEVCIDKRRTSKTFATKREARAWADGMEESGITSRYSLRAAIGQYRPIAEARKGWQAELCRLKTLEAMPFVDTPLPDISPAVVSAWRDARLAVVAPVTVRRELIMLSAIFRLAIREWGWCKTNPVAQIDKPRAGPARRRGVSEVEIRGICAQLERTPQGRQVAQMFRLAIETGMRLGELCSLRWADVEDKFVRLRATKNGDVREVPLSVAARAVIHARRGVDPDDVFTITANAASLSFQRARTAAGHADVHFHDSRAEAVTRLSKKLDVMQLARMIGHRDIKSLLFYYSEKADAIADRL